jgi:tetratricopeptide (TPR) repeat protein
MSDLWGWVVTAARDLRKQGHGRLADVMMSLPTEVCQDRHARADALAAEGLALCQALDQPWIEVYLRHWQLQSRVLHRMEGEAALGECVDLVDRSHQPDTKRCPQSVCTVQDLASCYANVDGPGYARERLAVADEALARIDPSWPCFSCISSEKAAAIRDQGDAAGSLAFLDAQVAAMVLAGQPKAIHDMPRERVEALIALGRWDDALAYLDDGDENGRTSAHAVMDRRIARARLLARLGRLDEALRALPTAAEVAPTPLFFASYAEAVDLLARGGRIPNDGALGRTLAGFVDRLVKQGVLRDALHLAERHGLLAVERDALHTAQRALATMELIAAKLSRPLDAPFHVATMRAGFLRAEAELPEARTPEEVLAHLAAERPDPERALLVLDLACREHPGDPALARARAQALRAQGLPDEAAEVMAALCEAHPDDVDLAISAKRLGMDLPGEGVIDAAGEPCHLRFDDGQDLLAQRTGPVTARVLGISVPPRAQRYGEVWVFQARPLNAPPSDDQERERHLWTYPVVTRLHPSPFQVFFLFGLHPGEQSLASIQAALEEVRCRLHVLSGERYLVGDDGARGIYAALPVPDDAPLAEVHATLVRSVESCGAELTWADLALAAGEETVAAALAATARRLGL